jgi:phage recombination protein Bet
MSSEIARQSGYPATDKEIAQHVEAVRTAMTTSLYPGASNASIDAVLAYCKAGDLDPMTKPVHIVQMSVKVGDQYEKRDIILPGINLYRTKAHRTGQYAGQDAPEFGPTQTFTVGDVVVTYPDWCRITIYRVVPGAGRVAFVAVAYWAECYATKGRSSKLPNEMWEKRPWGQLEKCTEALALRKAFPEEVGAQPTVEEMEGKLYYSDAPEPAAAIDMPKSKADMSAKQEPATVDADFKDADVKPEPEQKKADKPAATPKGKGKVEESKPEPEKLEAGYHGLTDSQQRILAARAQGVGLDEKAMFEKFGGISTANINKVMADLRNMADK